MRAFAKINLVAAGLALLALAATPARADVVMFQLNQGNTQLTNITPGPYGKVTVTQSGNTATFLFESFAGFVFLDGGSAGVNLNATAWTLGPITASNSQAGFTTPTYTNDLSDGNVDGWGKFNEVLKESDGYGSAVTSISFTITETSGPTWTSVSNVLAGNNLGNVLVAHIGICDNGAPCLHSDTATNTGYATTSGFPGSSTAAEPGSASLALLALGLLGAGFWTRRKT